MVNTEVTFAGFKLKNPIGVAPQAPYLYSEPDKHADLLMSYVELGASFVNTTSIRPEMEHPEEKMPTGKFMRLKTKGKGKFSSELLFAPADRERIQHRLKWGMGLIENLRNRLPDSVPIIANIVNARPNPEEWVNHAKRIEEAGAHIIEINPSCPLEPPEMKEEDTSQIRDIVPSSLGDSPEVLCEIIKAVSENVSVPVGVKFSPETGFPRLINAAYRFYKSGACYVTGVNAPVSIAPPDIYNNGKGFYPAFEANPFAPIVGPWNRFICYRNTAAVAKYIPALDIASAGGIVETEHIIEAIMLGAKVVELSSAIILKGKTFIKNALSFLNKFMDKHGYISIDEFRGISLKYIVPPATIDWGIERLKAYVKEDKCNGCGICWDNICYAIDNNKNKLPAISKDMCSACGMCVAICPKEAIELLPV